MMALRWIDAFKHHVLTNCAGPLEAIMDLFDDTLAYGLNIDMMQLINENHRIGRINLTPVSQPWRPLIISDPDPDPRPNPRNTTLGPSSEAPPSFRYSYFESPAESPGTK